MDIFKKCYDYKLADEAKEAGIYPYFHELTSKQDTEVEMEGIHQIIDKVLINYLRSYYPILK